MNRYDRNRITLSKEENELLLNSKVCVVGCGGLGGYGIEMLGRLGVGYITAIDGDVFDVTNLNRQILSDVTTLGKSKAYIAKKRMALVNDEVSVYPIQEYLNKQNASALLDGHQVIVDALDHIPTRFLVQKACEDLNIPYVYGAIGGWFGQVSTILPGDRTLDRIYRNEDSNGKEKILGNPSFTPALISSIQVGEVVKILINRGELLRNKLLFADVLNQEYEVVEL